MTTNIPYLTPDQFCQGDYTNGDQHCILEWVDRVFGGKDTIHFDTLSRQLMMLEIRDIIGEEGIISWNDAPTTTPEMIADTFNQAAQRLKRKMGVLA